MSACLLFYFIFLNTLVLKSHCDSRPPRDQLTIIDGLTSGELSSVAVGGARWGVCQQEVLKCSCVDPQA